MGGRTGGSFSYFIVVLFLVAHTFTELQSGSADYCYMAFGKLSTFVYSLVQKIKASFTLPVNEKWETSMPPDLSCFDLIAREQFL